MTRKRLSTSLYGRVERRLKAANNLGRVLVSPLEPRARDYFRRPHLLLLDGWEFERETRSPGVLRYRSGGPALGQELEIHRGAKTVVLRSFTFGVSQTVKVSLSQRPMVLLNKVFFANSERSYDLQEAFPTDLIAVRSRTTSSSIERTARRKESPSLYQGEHWVGVRAS
jgi:hypothetical protein